MIRTLCKKTVMGSIAVAFFLAGCSSTQTMTRRYVWPRAPEQPRIEWLKSYYDQNDFPKTDFVSAIEFLFGQSAPLAFEKPIDIKSNGKGLVYVTDVVKQAIFVYDLVNYKVTVWRRGEGKESFLGINPTYISLDRDGNLYAVGSGDQNIYVLDSNGGLIRKIDYSDKIKTVAGIAIDNAKNRIYVVDYGGSKVEAYELTSGKHLFSFGKLGEKDGEFNRPSPIVISQKGELIVGDVMNARIQIFNSEGKFLRKFGQRGDQGSDFQVIKGVAVDSDNNIYVTDGKANQVKIFSYKGDYLLTFGTAYSVTTTLKEAPGGFLLPQGIYIDNTDTIYIADQANMRFQVFRYLKEGGGAGESVIEKAPLK